MPIEEYEITALRQQITHLEGQVEFLYKHLGVTFVPEARPADDPRIVELVKKGKTIDAIKLYRQLKGASLPEANQAVQDMQRRLGI